MKAVTSDRAGPPPAGPLLSAQPTDRLLAIYAGLAGLALLFPHRPATWLWIALLHLAAIALGFRFAPAAAAWNGVERRWPRAAQRIGDLYPLILIPFLYAELPLLNQAVWNGRYFDPLILRIEQTLFGEPFRTWAASAPLLPLSELLHGFYLSYYLIIFLPPLVIGLTRGRTALRSAVFALMLAFIVHYLFFIYLPVQGPRYLFPAPGGPIAEGSLYQLAHRVLEAGSSRGAAFPSSHVGVAVAQTIICWRFVPRLAPLILALAVGLAFGAVYGGFHYAFDATVGAVLGGLAAAVAPAMQRVIAGGEDRPSVAGARAAADMRASHVIERD